MNPQSVFDFLSLIVRRHDYFLPFIDVSSKPADVAKAVSQVRDVLTIERWEVLSSKYQIPQSIVSKLNSAESYSEGVRQLEEMDKKCEKPIIQTKNHKRTAAIVSFLLVCLVFIALGVFFSVKEKSPEVVEVQQPTEAENPPIQITQEEPPIETPPPIVEEPLPPKPSDAEFLELCRAGTPKQISDAVKAGANIHAKNEEGIATLMFAANNNPNAEVIDILVKAGADVNAKKNISVELGRGGETKNVSVSLTPLIAAAEKNSNPAVIKALIKAGAELDKGLTWTPLMAAAENNQNHEIVETLIEAGANVNAVFPFSPYPTPLLLASEKSQNPKVITTLIKAGADLSGGRAEPAIMVASYSNPNPEIITALVKSGAKVNARIAGGFTPLIYAAMDNSSEIVMTLIKLGADVNLKDDYGNAALRYATENHSLSGTEALRTLESRTKPPFDIAEFIRICKNGTLQEINNAIRLGADVNATYNDKELTPLIIAAFYNPNELVISALVKAGANMNFQNNDGLTALMIAAINNNSKVVEMLLDLGANPYLRCKRGHSALTYAMKNPKLKHTRALEELAITQ